MPSLPSVFRDAMGPDLNFPFKFLVSTGGGSKSEVAGRADSTIYILAKKELRNEVCNKLHTAIYYETAVEGGSKISNLNLIAFNFCTMQATFWGGKCYIYFAGLSSAYWMTPARIVMLKWKCRMQWLQA